jgi:hypothetical protein
VPGLKIRQARAVTHAPNPKKKMTNPGTTSSSINNNKPIRNQRSSGRDNIDVPIILLTINEVSILEVKIKEKQYYAKKTLYTIICIR